MRNRPGLSQATAALAYADYRRFVISLLGTQLGAQILNIATLWQVYQISGSPLLLGLTGIARAVPHIVLSLAGGVIADRLNRVRLIQAGQLANAAVALALGALTLTQTVDVWHIYLATFLNSAFSAVSQPARTALIPKLVPPAILVNAVALQLTIGQTSQIVGPALGGAAMAAIDLGPTYVITGLAYLGGVLALVRVHVTEPAITKDSPWRSLVEGLSFVRQKPVIVSLLVLDVGETVLGSYRALLPVLAVELGVGPEGYGLLNAAPGLGGVLGATFILSLGDMRYKGLFTVFGVLAYCVALIVLALSPWFPVSLLAAGLLGTTNALQMIPRNAAILAISPDALRGRVEAFRTMRGPRRRARASNGPGRRGDILRGPGRRHLRDAPRAPRPRPGVRPSDKRGNGPGALALVPAHKSSVLGAKTSSRDSLRGVRPCSLEYWVMVSRMWRFDFTP
jgi:MFS family permease